MSDVKLARSLKSDGAASGLALAFALTIAPAVAQQAPVSAPSTPALTGSTSLGVRSVDLTGTEAKYREDVNLDDGVRLFGVHLSYVPRVGEAPVDRIDLDADNLGGDPFESIHLGVRKYGAYNLKLDRRRSAYFYDDTILPAALASVSGSTGGDFHTFDFERIRSTAALDIDVTPATKCRSGSSARRGPATARRAARSSATNSISRSRSTSR